MRVIDHHFNVSSANSSTIIVKTEAPYLSIRDPGGEDIVNREFYIEGRIEDNDFSAFQLLISNYRAGKNAKMEGQSSSQLLYRVILEATAALRTETLATLNKTDFEDGDSQIWLTTQDQQQHLVLIKSYFGWIIPLHISKL